jgi:hypothetical protein
MERIPTFEKGIFEVKTNCIGGWEKLQRVAYSYYEHQRLA